MADLNPTEHFASPQSIDVLKKSGMALTAIVQIFLAAIMVRIAYDIAIFIALSDKGFLSVDSLDYLRHARVLVDGAAGGQLHGWDWFGPEPNTMPLFAWTSALTAAISQPYSTLSLILFQSVLDSATCVFIYAIALRIDERIALPAAIAAIVNPTQIVMAGLYYPDTQFAFFISIFLFGTVRWLAMPSLISFLIIAGGLAGAEMTRILSAPFGFALFAFLLLISILKRQFCRPIAAQFFLGAIIIIAPLVTISARNYAKYDSWMLTPQTGIHLAGWVVPLVREAKDGTPWRTTFEAMQRRAHAQFKPMSNNPFEKSRQYTQIATDKLSALGPAAIIKAWAFGAMINLGSPAIILSPPIALLPRTGFYETPGKSMANKMWNFLFHSSNNLYALFLLAGVCGLVIVRFIQACGATAMAISASNQVALLVFGGWIAYILLANGPVASPKYRLPIEPVLCVMTGAGWVRLRNRIPLPRSPIFRLR